MSTLRDLVVGHTGFSASDIDHLHRLAADWQLLADLAFADLLLWVPTLDPYDEDAFLCVAHIRPTTGPTAHHDDQVGRMLPAAEALGCDQAVATGQVWRAPRPVSSGGTASRRETVPVCHAGRVIAVLGRDTNLAITRAPSALERNYLRTADDLCHMVADGTFPAESIPEATGATPRVGDGLIRIGIDGLVEYASPNAQSAFRRAGFSGDLVGTHFPALAASLADDPLQGGETAHRVLIALRGRTPPMTEIETAAAVVLLRALPLRPQGQAAGALVLLGDITEVRRRDQALMTKDATIREIHHRVKNNLQTVAALLRMQARRVSSDDARAALSESVRRVASIALVHETLSQSFDEAVPFDEVADGVVEMVSDVAATETEVKLRRSGSFGELPAQIATPLVLVVSELLTNSLEHGFAAGQQGEVVLEVHREDLELTVRVIDDGIGLPGDFKVGATNSLGLQIVRALVTGELGGTLDISSPGTGTRAQVRLPVAPRVAPSGHDVVSP